ncbi:hypothetical protein HYS84_01760 [Candidatus Saccharibacteria bacterium]|nr:hypothetical protein [Candidatus Saccharibacteria bacterium]
MDDEILINNRVRTEYVARQLREQLTERYRESPFEEVILNNLAMLFILRKSFFSYMEFLKNIHTRQQEYDERIDQPGSPQSFIHGTVTSSALLYCCLITGKKSGRDFGSINKFAKKNWSSDDIWRESLKPSESQKRFSERAFHLRNKLIAHIDLNLEQVIKEDDILKLISFFDDYIVPTVQKIFEEFLGHNQDGSLDFEDLSIQTYRLLYPFHPEIPRQKISWSRENRGVENLTSYLIFFKVLFYYPFLGPIHTDFNACY